MRGAAGGEMGLAVGWWRSHEEVRLRRLGMAEGGDSHEEAGQSLYGPPACSSKEARSPEAWRAWLPVGVGGDRGRRKLGVESGEKTPKELWVSEATGPTRDSTSNS